MSRSAFSLVAVPALACIPTVALAQITPEEVWQSWKDLPPAMMYAVTSQGEARDGDRLVLDGVTIRIDDGTMQMAMPLGQVVMQAMGDGTVEVTMPEAYELTADISEPGRERVVMRMAVEQPGLRMRVSGRPGAQIYDYSADSMSIVLTEAMVDGEDLPLDMSYVFEGLAGTAGVRFDADSIAVDYALRIAGIEIAMAVEDPSEGLVDATVRFVDVATDFTGTLPSDLDPQAELPELLASGVAGKGALRFGQMAIAAVVDSEDQELDLAVQTGSGSLGFELSPEAVRYDTALRGVEIEASGSEIPFPDFRITMAEQAFGVMVPLMEMDGGSDFGFLLRLVEVALPDAVLGMLDPFGNLPRDPVTIILDTKGKVNMMGDLMTTLAMMEGDGLGALQALSIDALQLKAAGADLTGKGSFVFDADDLDTFPGVPRPAGSAEFALSGGNTLIDKLVDMGLLPPDQVMGLRMMLALFTRPGDGPDTMTSTIEITPEGAILANGQRIQ